MIQSTSPDYNSFSHIARLLRPFFSQPRGVVSKSNDDLLSCISEEFGIKTLDYPSTTNVHGWEVPPSWELESATVICNKQTLTHLDSAFIVPFGTESWSFCGLYSDAEPFIVEGRHYGYRTNYYSPQNHLLCLPDYFTANCSSNDQITIDIRTKFSAGSMKVGLQTLRGRSSKSIIISTYCCHPGLGNDNFSGILGWCFLLRAMKLLRGDHHYTYHFVIAPETIGAIYFIDFLRKQNLFSDCLHAHILTCLGGHDRRYSYKDSPYPNPYSNYFLSSLQAHLPTLQVRSFTHDGSDERQYSSPNVRLSSSSLCRNRYYEYPEYHTSADSYEFMSEDLVYETTQYFIQALLCADSQLRIPTSTYCCGEPPLYRFDISFHNGGESISSSGFYQGISKAHFFYAFSRCDGRLSYSELVSEISAACSLTLDQANSVLSFLLSHHFVAL